MPAGRSPSKPLGTTGNPRPTYIPLKHLRDPDANATSDDPITLPRSRFKSGRFTGTAPPFLSV
jgi:hypothetical protein